MRNLECFRTGYGRYVDVDHAIKLDANEELAELTNTPLHELRNYDNWYFINGDYYYLKDKSELYPKSLANELLGEYLSEYFNLPTIHYQIAERDGLITGLISNNFKDPGKNYFKIDELTHAGVSEVRSIIKNILDDPDFDYDYKVKSDLLRYIVRNFYSSICDRKNNVLIAQSYEHPFEVAPLFDYESSFIDTDMDTYIDPLFKDGIDFDRINFLYNNNEEFRYYFNLLNKFNISKAINEIEDKHKIMFPSKLHQIFIEFDKYRKEVLRENVKGFTRK